MNGFLKGGWISHQVQFENFHMYEPEHASTVLCLQQTDRQSVGWEGTKRSWGDYCNGGASVEYQHSLWLIAVVRRDGMWMECGCFTSRAVALKILHVTAPFESLPAAGVHDRASSLFSLAEKIVNSSRTQTPPMQSPGDAVSECCCGDCKWSDEKYIFFTRNTYRASELRIYKGQRNSTIATNYTFTEDCYVNFGGRSAKKITTGGWKIFPALFGELLGLHYYDGSHKHGS